MGFLLQLRLLLWKNFTLKKRSPFLVLFEILIPLVLFLVLMGIRLHKPPYSSNERHFIAKPMPSAGIIPLLQSFCPNAFNHVNKHGFIDFPSARSRITKLLSHLADIYNSKEIESLKGVQHLQEEISALVKENNIEEDSLRIFKDLSLSDVLRDQRELKKFLISNISMSEDSADAILHSKVNGKELSSFLLERRYDEFFKQFNGTNSIEQMQELRSAVLLQYLLDKSSLLRGPTWMRILRSTVVKDQELNNDIMQTLLMKSFFDSERMHEFFCGPEFSKMVIFRNISATQKLKVKKELCHLNADQLHLLAQELKTNVNYTTLAEKMRFNGKSLLHYRDLIVKIQNDLLKLGNLEKLVQMYNMIAEDLNFDTSRISRASNKSHSQQIVSHAKVIWHALGPIICGSSHSEEEGHEQEDVNDFILKEGASNSALKFAFYALTNDPKILYAPNGTEADAVISKTGHLLALIKQSKEFAQNWLNTSRMIQQTLKRNSTQNMLKTILRYSNSYPYLLRDWVTNISHYNIEHDPYTKRALAYNETIKQYVNQSQIKMKEIIEELLLDDSGTSRLMRRMEFIDRSATVWLTLLKPIKLDIFYGFPSEKALSKYYMNISKQSGFKKYVYSAIIFDNMRTDGVLPRHVIYRVRMNGQLMPSTRKIRSRNWYPGPNSYHVNYYSRGFVWLQDQLERAISEVLVGHNITSPGLYIHEMPYPCYLKDHFMFVIQYMMPLCITVSFIYSVAILVQSIVHEKEQRLKEVMKVMGLSNAVHWTAWFITSTCLMTIIVLLMTLILKYGGILKYSDPLIVWLFLTLSSVATTVFCFLISVFFSKAKLAAACGGIIYFLTYMPYVLISIREGAHVNVDSAWKSFASLFSTTAFGLGARYFALYEQDGKGLQWNNMSESPLLNDEFSLGHVLAMLIADTFLYGILTWYIEHVFPGAYGLPRAWYFPFQISYWLGDNSRHCSGKRSRSEVYSRMSSVDNDSPPGLLAMDAEPVHLPHGVVIQDLVKVYVTGKRAVDHISLNLYEGQITSLLGHNGAGKTTTMSILTGLFPPTTGTAYIYGHDIRTDMDEIRTSLGMCPQHNVLFESLTVDEHLWFYAMLKGMPSSDVGSEVDRILEDLELPSKRNSKVESLSGGMKRKLSVAMAFVGGSRTVILDEPTAGIDPYARRAIWDLLVKYKAGRTILLSTHFMDEADILGDRIAIVSCGKLRCCGSSLFLKSQFGDGYHLTLVKEKKRDSSAGASPSLSPSRNSAMLPQEITEYIRDYVPSAQLICETHHELSYILPKDSSHNASFKNLFASLEENKEKLGCGGFGLTDTSLEEVFLKVTEASIQNEPGDSDLVGEVTATLPEATMERNTSQRDGDSGIELDQLTLTAAKKEPLPIPEPQEVLDLKRRSKPTHKRSMSSDFFRDSKSQPVVTCVHRKNPCGRICGHRRALSSDFRIDKVVNIDEFTEKPKKPMKNVLFGHRRNASNTSQISHDSTVIELDEDAHASAKKYDKVFQQIFGLFLKRFHHSRRNFKGLISQIFLPAIFVCIAMTVAMSRPEYEKQPQLILSPTMIRPLPNAIPFNNEGTSQISKRMERSLRLPSGIGADCVLKHANSSIVDLYQLSPVLSDNLKMFDSVCNRQLSTFASHRTRLGQKARGTQSIPDDEEEKNTVKKCRCSDDKRKYICDRGVEGHPEEISTMTGDKLINVTGRNMEQYLLYTTKHFRRHRYGGFTFGEERKVVPESFDSLPFDDIKRLYSRHAAKVWFNNKGYHALPAYLNSLSNTVLRSYVSKKMGNPAAYGITAVYHPFSLAKNGLSQDYIKQGTDVVIAIFVIIAMSFVPASFVVFLVTERVTKAKHLQFVSGAEPLIYWLVNFFWDMCNYLIPALACMLILYLFQLPAYSSQTNFPAVCCLFLLYGWSITPLMYPATFLFKEASTAYVVLIVVNLFIGITFTVTVFILELFPNDPELSSAYETLRLVSLMFPNYCLGRGLMDLAFTEYSNSYYKLIGEFDKLQSPFKWDLISRSLVLMAIEGFIFFSFTVLIEYLGTCKRRKACMESKSLFDDVDVTAEHERVLSGEADDDLLRLENLTKVCLIRETVILYALNVLCIIVIYTRFAGLLLFPRIYLLIKKIVEEVEKIYRSRKTGNHLAVHSLCLGVPRGECFGLLGVNGAGKTSTFKMLTGDTPVTAGDAFVLNKSIISDALKVHKMIGYCPQFDALIDELTAEEHLALYSRLRGIPESSVKKVVNWAIEKLALGRYAYKPSKTYSGGNKRKLSAAIALIGNPPLIFMDEPTTGMDPGARRFLWNLILSIIHKGTRSVILTSHSMEECEALCTRLGIMVNGKFKCLGSTQHLKNKFGEGYMVALRVRGNSPDLEPVKRYFEEKVPDAVLKEHHHNLLQYQIHSTSRVALSDIFACLKDYEESTNIEDFSVSQTTLENVFINFARDQMDKQEIDGAQSEALSPIERMRQLGSSIRRTVRSQRSVQFSRLLISRQNHSSINDDSFVDEDDLLSVDFQSPNAQLQLLQSV